MAYVEVKNMFKHYKMGQTTITANNDINFSLEKGEFVVIVGPSGSGKSTVLNIIGGMDTCDKGHILVDGKDIAKINSYELTKYRRYDVGFVFQFYNLIPNLTAKENVELASQIVKNSMPADQVLDMVGLSHRMSNFPAQLSGGEQQRVAIARALAKKPKLLLCDEPTGALDYKTGKAILQLLQDTCIQTGTTVIVITHNQAITPIAHRVIEFNDAKVRDIYLNENPKSIQDIEW